MSIFFRMRGGVKVPRVKGVGAMVDDGHRHIPHSPPVLLASICVTRRTQIHRVFRLQTTGVDIIP